MLHKLIFSLIKHTTMGDTVYSVALAKLEVYPFSVNSDLPGTAIVFRIQRPTHPMAEVQNNQYKPSEGECF